MDNEAILRLVAVAQSGAYYAYVSICGASQTPKIIPSDAFHQKFVWRREFQGLRSVRNRSLLDVNEDFKHERNAEITPSGKFFLEALTNSKEILSLQSSTTNQTTINILLCEDLGSV